MEYLNEIKKFLKEKSNKKAKESWRKFIPTANKIWGVYLSDINKLVSKFSGGGFQLVEKLWDNGYLEERILAAKILGKIGKEDPDKVLDLIEKFVEDIEDWAVCDTLATQGIRSIYKIKQRDILNLSKKLIKSENFWKRRFAVVLLINLKKESAIRDEILNIVKQVENDKNRYVTKAVDRFKRSFELS